MLIGEWSQVLNQSLNPPTVLKHSRNMLACMRSDQREREHVCSSVTPDSNRQSFHWQCKCLLVDTAARRKRCQGMKCVFYGSCVCVCVFARACLRIKNIEDFAAWLSVWDGTHGGEQSCLTVRIHCLFVCMLHCYGMNTTVPRDSFCTHFLIMYDYIMKGKPL